MCIFFNNVAFDIFGTSFNYWIAKLCAHDYFDVNDTDEVRYVDNATYAQIQKNQIELY